MVYTTYTPTYYTSLHDTITSLCKNVLPFSLKKKRLAAIAAGEQSLAQQQSENIKWQQESFHRILNLIGLQKEGILPESEVSAFRTDLLEALIRSPPEHEQTGIIRDKLLFLQELLHAKCISDEEYHSSKRPLLQRLAVQGATVDCRDEIPAASGNAEEEWSVIEFKDEQSLIQNDSMSPAAANKAKNGSLKKRIKGSTYIIGMASSHRFRKNRGMTKGDENSAEETLRPSLNASDSFKENPFWDEPSKSNGVKNQSILRNGSSPKSVEEERATEKAKKKPFLSLFQKERINECSGRKSSSEAEESASKSSSKQWSFKKWKRSKLDEETAPYLPPGERSDDAMETPCVVVPSPIGEGPNTRLIKEKIHSDGSASDFFIDKVLGENIRKELSQIQTESTANPSIALSNEQIDAISTRLPVDKADLNNFFPKSWCDRYGDIVLDVVKKEFKDHIGENSLRCNPRKKRGNNNLAEGWVAFEEENSNEENTHPNLFFQHSSSSNSNTTKHGSSSNSYCYTNGNSFHGSNSDCQNPFWSPQ